MFSAISARSASEVVARGRCRARTFLLGLALLGPEMEGPSHRRSPGDGSLGGASAVSWSSSVLAAGQRCSATATSAARRALPIRRARLARRLWPPVAWRMASSRNGVMALPAILRRRAS
jgi:hypothetical protein